MKNTKRISTIKIIISALLCLILIYNLIIICKSFLYPNETPDFFGVKTYIVASGSMVPKLDIGDIVVVKDVPQLELNEGDIISFREGQKVVTHRIHSIVLVNGELMYRTKGDNNNAYDSQLVDYNDIEGKMIIKIAGIGNLLISMQKSNVIIFVVVIYYIYILLRGLKKK